jgi:hypothetical protein
MSSHGRVAVGTGGIFLAYGIQDLVPADGSTAATITFSSAFATAVLTNPILGIDGGGAATAYILTTESFNTTTTGFEVIVYGGSATTTVTVSYLILGD